MAGLGFLDPFNFFDKGGRSISDKFLDPLATWRNKDGKDGQPAPEGTSIGEDIYGWMSGYIGAMADPTMNKALLSAEETYRPEWTRLGLLDQENTMFGVGGQGGTLSMLERMMPQISQMQASALSAQRGADIGDIEQLGGRATAALRASDPQRAALMAKQEELTNRLYGMAERVTPEQQRMAQQQAREGNMARGRGFDQSGIASEILGREQVMATRRAEAQQSGAQLFGMYQQTTADPFQAILGRPGMAFSGAQQQQAYGGGAASQFMGPQLYDPNAGINVGLQQQSNMLNYNAAMQGASASKKAGQMQAGGAVAAAAIPIAITLI